MTSAADLGAAPEPDGIAGELIATADALDASAALLIDRAAELRKRAAALVGAPALASDQTQWVRKGAAARALGVSTKTIGRWARAANAEKRIGGAAYVDLGRLQKK